MSNREDYEWRKEKLLLDFGCLATIGLGVIVCTGFVKYGFRDGFEGFLHPKVSVSQQVGDTSYVFVCPEEDKKNCDKNEEYLHAVYEHSTPRNWQHAPVSWVSDPTDTESCRRDSYILGQCYGLAPKKGTWYKKYLEERVTEKQNE
ncbi:MAG TPA: hypothetical protein HA360_06335 [Nanoarchaeota archaeon]|nr:hypothetical protein [Candidatus Woesearchaeota archaeon]HII14662.1 hypothetical protein [Nanoarchaeota archaeon]HIJ04849.1 hypothetical protein [Nanoarchaeota archaeon]